MNTKEIRKQIIKLIKLNLDNKVCSVMKRNKNYLSCADMKCILGTILYYECIETLQYMFEESRHRHDLKEFLLSFEMCCSSLIMTSNTKYKSIDLRQIHMQVGIYLMKVNLIRDNVKWNLMFLMMVDGPTSDDWDILRDGDKRKILLDFYSEAKIADLNS